MLARATTWHRSDEDARAVVRAVLHAVSMDRAKPTSRGEISLACPLCGDAGEHLYVNPARGLYNCFRCRRAGKVTAAALVVADDWRRLAATFRGRRSGAALPLPAHLIPLVGWEAVLGGRMPPVGLPSLLAKGYAYCLGRGVTPEQVERYAAAVRYGEARVYWPVMEEGALAFYVARAIGDEEPKTIEPLGSIKPLYGRQVRRLRDDVVLVEGVFDHLATPHSYGYLGSVITREQAATLRDDGVRRAFVLGDPDAAEQVLASCERLRSIGLRAVAVYLLSGNSDPADLGRGRMSEIVGYLRRLNLWAHGPVRVRV